MAVEYPAGDPPAVQAARDVLGADADCYRAYDVICESGQLGDLHVATVAGPGGVHEALPGQAEVAAGRCPRRSARSSTRGATSWALSTALAKAGRPARTRASRRGACWPTWPARPASCRSSAGWTSWRNKWPCRSTTTGPTSARSSPSTATGPTSTRWPCPRARPRVVSGAFADRWTWPTWSLRAAMIHALRALRGPAGDAAWACRCTTATSSRATSPAATQMDARDHSAGTC